MDKSEGKLTKKFFMSITSGVYLISNTADNNQNPIFAEYVVSSQEKKEEQWKRIKEVRADNRLSILFKSKKEANSYIEKLKKSCTV
jgi:hypothetical protein